LYKTAPSLSVQRSEKVTVVADGSLEMTKLGIYTIDTVLDGRGPGLRRGKNNNGALKQN
jgi:hypothetical protein